MFVNCKIQSCLDTVVLSQFSTARREYEGLHDYDTPLFSFLGFHFANAPAGNKRLRGIRAWNTDQCLERLGDEKPREFMHTYVCDIAGGHHGEYFALDEHGNLKKLNIYEDPAKAGSGTCVDGALNQGAKCLDKEWRESGAWMAENFRIPLERELYDRARRETPEIFGGL